MSFMAILPFFVVDFLEMKRCLEGGWRLEIDDHMVEMQDLG
jgi:hypothetical protein